MNELKQVLLDGLAHIKVITAEMGKLKLSMITDKTSVVTATANELSKRVEEFRNEVDILDALDSLVGALRNIDHEAGVTFYIANGDVGAYQRAYQLLRENGRRP